MILVTGATGRIGREVVQILSAEGEQVRALVRDPRHDRAVALRNPNVELFEGDLGDPASLAPAMYGIAAVLLLGPLTPDQVLQQGHVIAAARRADVRFVVKISAHGAGPNAPVSFGRWHGQTEQQLVDSGLGWAILRPQYFMQNLLAFAPSIADDRVLAVPLGEARIAMVDVRDVAAVAASVLTHAELGGRIYDLTGPDAVSFAHVADRFSSLTGHTVRYVDTPPETARRDMLENGMPEWLADGLCDLYGVLRAGDGAATTSVVRELTGRDARSFDQFARDHAFTFGA